MQIFGLYGKSGTGKSHKSIEVMSKYEIDAVIDDGILIMNKIRVAGSSAKNERYMHSATKRAIFHSEEHRREVINAIQAHQVQKMLIIGTSQKMVLRIIDRLNLPENVIWLPIEQYQTAEELRIAKERRSRGYHIIPIQPIEVEKTYSGWFRRLIVRFGKRKEEVTLIKPFYNVTSGVKPDFVGSGRIVFHAQAIRKMIVISSRNYHKLILNDIRVGHDQITVVLSVYYGESIQLILDWRNQIVDELTELLGIRYTINVEWKAVIPNSKQKSFIF